MNVKVKIYKTIILPAALNGCETWSLTLWEEHKLRVFENRVLKRIFGLKRDDVMGEWRKLHSDEPHSMFPSLNIIILYKVKVNEVGRACGTHRRGERSVQGFGGKAQRKEILRRPRHRWEDGIRMDLRETGWGCGLDLTGSRQGLIVSCGECSDEPSGSCAT
jgi:hypothetical protein